MGTKDHTVPQSYTKTISNHSIPKHSREDSRPLATASPTIMIVVHFAKVSVMYP
jgi:hypothetical protein